MSRARRTLALTTSLAVVATGGCGDSSDAPPPLPPSPEVAQELPKLPPGWKPHRDRSIGYAIGIPPGWKLEGKGGRVLIRSPSHLVAVTLAVDRNEDALGLPLGGFATRALAAIPGFKARLEPSKPRPFRGTSLQAVETTARGETKQGLTERATLIVLRRDRLVNYAVAVLENTGPRASRAERAVALRMVRTLRDQPVEPRAAPESR